MSYTSTSLASEPAGNGLQAGLWIAQVLVFAAFTLFGAMKIFMPVEAMASMWVWPGQVPPAFLRIMGVIDVAGGLGVLLPALTRVQPRLGVLASLGCVLLQVAAMVFHTWRGEYSALPLNLILLALSAFILWGRGSRAPIEPRA